MGSPLPKQCWLWEPPQSLGQLWLGDPLRSPVHWEPPGCPQQPWTREPPDPLGIPSHGNPQIPQAPQPQGPPSPPAPRAAPCPLTGAGSAEAGPCLRGLAVALVQHIGALLAAAPRTQLLAGAAGAAAGTPGCPGPPVPAVPLIRGHPARGRVPVPAVGQPVADLRCTAMLSPPVRAMGRTPWGPHHGTGHEGGVPVPWPYLLEGDALAVPAGVLGAGTPRPVPPLGGDVALCDRDRAVGTRRAPQPQYSSHPPSLTAGQLVLALGTVEAAVAHPGRVHAHTVVAHKVARARRDLGRACAKDTTPSGVTALGWIP